MKVTTRKRRGNNEIDVFKDGERIGHYTKGRFRFYPYDLGGNCLPVERAQFPGDVTGPEGAVAIIVSNHEASQR